MVQQGRRRDLGGHARRGDHQVHRLRQGPLPRHCGGGVNRADSPESLRGRRIPRKRIRRPLFLFRAASSDYTRISKLSMSGAVAVRLVAAPTRVSSPRPPSTEVDPLKTVVWPPRKVSKLTTSSPLPVLMSSP